MKKTSEIAKRIDMTQNILCVIIFLSRNNLYVYSYDNTLTVTSKVKFKDFRREKQWQRIAIARGLYRDYDVIVLDEPTAAIDPIEESNIFRLFKESAKGKTAVLVTHRLGSTKIADRILLMEEGSICELGTHKQLMALNGKYMQRIIKPSATDCSSLSPHHRFD